jgi:hypothetical protein
LSYFNPSAFGFADSRKQPPAHVVDYLLKESLQTQILYYFRNPKPGMARLVKRQLLPVALFSLWSSVSLAASATREALIDQIETQYVSTAMFASDSPVVSSILQPAMTANPGVSAETWQSVKKETAEALTKVITEKGSTMDVLIRSSLESFSDKELKELSQVISDPSFRKFQAAMSGPAAQQQLHAGMAKLGVELAALINTVLVNHHLNEVH